MESNHSLSTLGLMDVANEITVLNPGTVLTGSLLLDFVGINLGRAPHDIDILVEEDLEAEDLVFPEGSEVLPIERHEEYSVLARIKHKGVKIDFISPVGQKFSRDYKDLLLGTIEAKIAYVNEGTGDVRKQISDLYNIFKHLIGEYLEVREH